MQKSEKRIKSYTGTYEMYISDGRIVVTGADKYKNFKGIFTIQEVKELLGDTDYREKYEKLCDDIKEQSRRLRREFDSDDCTSSMIRTSTGIYDRIVDKS